MKALSILMLLVFIASLVGVGYVYLTANVTVTATGIGVTEASAQPELFEELKTQVQEQAVIGTAYTTVVPEEAADYKYCTYRVQLKNNCLLDAEMVELQVTPRDGDVLEIGNQSVQTLKAGEETIFEATILTRLDSYTGREINITYYMWGKPFTLRTTVNGG